MDGLTDKTFGFIGLGAMGGPMVVNLSKKLSSGKSIYIYDIVEDLVEDLCKQNPHAFTKSSNPKHVAQECDIILTMLPEGTHVKDVYTNAETGICTADIGGKLLVDCSTIDTASSLEVKEAVAAAAASASFYDAPVSGGVIGAQKGTLAFFLGAAEDDGNLAALEAVLGAMGKAPIACGAPSLGLAAKLSNNYLSGVIAIACSEAMDMGMRSGLDPRVLARVYAAGTAQNAICDKFCPVPGVQPDAPSSKGYKGGFKVQLMRKDFNLAVEMADRVGTKLVLGDAGLSTYKAASEDPRCKDLDSRVVYRYLGGNEDWENDLKAHK